MADAPTSRIALATGDPVDLDGVVMAAREGGAIDRSSPLASDPEAAREVHWGGRLQRAVLRIVEEDGASLLRVETVVADEGWRGGLAHQARLVVGLADALATLGRPASTVHDLSARRVRDRAWLARAAEGALDAEAAVGIDVVSGPRSWLAVHGAARFGVPDLELYGVPGDRTERARSLLLRVQAALLEGGLGARIDDGSGRPLRLVPVLRAWPRLPLDWPGVGRGGRTRGPGLDGPRATLSLLHRPRLGRHRIDLAGVIAGL